MNVKLSARNSDDWHAAARLVRRRYQLEFGAEVEPSPDYFVVVSDPRGDGGPLLAGAGLSFGSECRFFSERYLDEHVEDLLARVEGKTVTRDSILEVGSLATSHRGSGLKLVRLLPLLAMALGKQYALCTLTRQMRTMFRAIGMTCVALAPADGARLSATELQRWGSYYDNDPVTVFIRVAEHRHFIARAALRCQFSFPEDDASASRQQAAGSP